jgi:alcohol dehydrogenase
VFLGQVRQVWWLRVQVGRDRLIIGVESDPTPAKVAKRMGADLVIDHTKCDAVEQMMTQGKGVDVAIEALGTQVTFQNARRVLRAGGTLSSLAVYSEKLSVPLEPFAAGLRRSQNRDDPLPGGKQCMRLLMELVAHGRLDLRPLLTHTFPLERNGGLRSFRRTKRRCHQGRNQAATEIESR